MDNPTTPDYLHRALSNFQRSGSSNSLHTPPAPRQDFESVATSASYNDHRDHEMLTTAGDEAAAHSNKSDRPDQDSTSTEPDIDQQETSASTATSTTAEEELPEQLMKLVNEFVASLREPRYEAPLTPNAISDLFQGFYSRFEERARDYLAELESAGSEGEMLAYNEIAARRARRQERTARVHFLTLQAENEACKQVYTKIFSVANAPYDRQRNDRLNRRIAVLRQLNITLVNLDFVVPKNSEKQSMENIMATEGTFQRFASDRTPKGKLMALRDIHRMVVQALGQNVDSAGADCLLPLLIYTSIQFSQDLGLHLKFIKRFRNKAAITSEEAYCLTNLEAVVEFLGTITLSGLEIKPQNIPQGLDLSCFDSNIPTPPDLPPRTRRRRALSDMRRANDPLMNPPSSPNSSSRSSRSNSLQNAPQYEGTGVAPVGQPGSVLVPSYARTRPDLQSLSSSLGSSYKFLVGRFMGKEDANNYPDTIDDVRHVLETNSTTAGSTARERDRDRDRSDTSTPSVLGKFVKNLRINSPALPSPSLDSEIISTGKLPVPINPHLLECDTNDLKLSDIKQLHLEYKLLVKYLSEHHLNTNSNTNTSANSNNNS